MFRDKDGGLTLQGIAPDPATEQVRMIGDVAEPREPILLCRMQSQGCWVQSLLTQFPIGGLNGRPSGFGALAPIAFEGFSDGSQLALFIVECATGAAHLRVSLSPVADTYPGRCHGNRIVGIFDQGRDQPGFDIHVGLENLFGMG